MNAEQMEEIKRHVGVVAEALTSGIRQIAEGPATIRHELQEHRGEIRDEFKEMRALLRLSFSSSTAYPHPRNGHLRLESPHGSPRNQPGLIPADAIQSIPHVRRLRDRSEQ
jgi:hypothetical protein